MKKKLNALVLFAHDHHHHHSVRVLCDSSNFLSLVESWNFDSLSLCHSIQLIRTQKLPPKKDPSLNILFRNKNQLIHTHYQAYLVRKVTWREGRAFWLSEKSLLFRGFQSSRSCRSNNIRTKKNPDKPDLPFFLISCQDHGEQFDRIISPSPKGSVVHQW